MAGIFSVINSYLVLLYGGWIFSWHWHWFVVPIFGAEEIGVGAATGIVLVAAALTHRFGISDMAVAMDAAEAQTADLQAFANFWPWIQWTGYGIFAWIWQAAML